MPILKWKNRITKSGSYYSLIVLPPLSNMPVTLKQFKEIIFRLSLPYPELWSISSPLLSQNCFHKTLYFISLGKRK